MRDKKEKWMRNVFYTISSVFIVLLSFFIVPDAYMREAFVVYAILGLIFLLLGVLLIVLAAKSKEKKKLKVIMILMGASAIGVPLGSVLHNVFYGLGMITEHIIWLHYVFEFLHAAFFLISLIGCPIVFLVTMIWGIKLFMKKKKS